MRSAFVILALLLLVSACGGDDEDGSTATPDEPAAVLPACAGHGANGSPEAELPVHFPLPPGTQIVSTASPFPSQVVVLGLVPGNFQSAAAFFNENLPAHGYESGIGDSEGSESEAPFTGNGYRGKWRVNSIPDCDAVRLTLVLIEQA